MSGKSGRTHEAARRRAERERQAGLEPDDEAARWLAEHEPRTPEPPQVSKSARKSKLLHQWRQRQRGS